MVEKRKKKWFVRLRDELTVKKHSVTKNCSSDLKIFANSRPSASNLKSFSRTLVHFFLTVGQNNFGNKIPFLRPLCKIRSNSTKKDQFTDGEKKSSLMSRTVRIGLHFIGGINTTRSNSHGSDIFLLILFFMYLFYKNTLLSYFMSLKFS